MLDARSFCVHTILLRGGCCCRARKTRLGPLYPLSRLVSFIAAPVLITRCGTDAGQPALGFAPSNQRHFFTGHLFWQSCPYNTQNRHDCIVSSWRTRQEKPTDLVASVCVCIYICMLACIGWPFGRRKYGRGASFRRIAEIASFVSYQVDVIWWPMLFWLLSVWSILYCIIWLRPDILTCWLGLNLDWLTPLVFLTVLVYKADACTRPVRAVLVLSKYDVTAVYMLCTGANFISSCLHQ